MWFSEVKTNESNTVADQMRSHIGTKYSQQGVLPRNAQAHCTPHNAGRLLHASYLGLSFFGISVSRCWWWCCCFCCGCSFFPFLFASFSPQFESMTIKSQKQHSNERVTCTHIKTMRAQWQLSAPPLNHHMTSCTYIYFTAITFYSYYRCSTFIFISHLCIHFSLLSVRCCVAVRKKNIYAFYRYRSNVLFF